MLKHLKTQLISILSSANIDIYIGNIANIYRYRLKINRVIGMHILNLIYALKVMHILNLNL